MLHPQEVASLLRIFGAICGTGQTKLTSDLIVLYVHFILVKPQFNKVQCNGILDMTKYLAFYNFMSIECYFFFYIHTPKYVYH